MISLTHAASTAGALLSYQELVLLGIEGVKDLRRSARKIHGCPRRPTEVNGRRVMDGYDFFLRSRLRNTGSPFLKL